MTNIYLLIEGKQEGPYPEKDVKEYIAGGQITSDQLAWREGLIEWVAVSNLLSDAVVLPTEAQAYAQSSAVTSSSSDEKALNDEVQNRVATLKSAVTFHRKWSAAEGLIKLGKPAVEPLIECLKDQDFNVRCVAARALGILGDARAAEPLTACSEDTHEDVRTSAAEALNVLRGDATSDPSSEPIGGWLWVPALGLILGIILTTIDFFVILGHLASLPTQFQTMFALFGLAEVVFLLFMIYASVRFFGQRRDAPGLMIALLLIDIAMAQYSHNVKMALSNSPENYGFLLGVLKLLILGPLFLYSKRVKRTFVM